MSRAGRDRPTLALVSLVLAGCASTGSTRLDYPALRSGGTRPVTAITMWTSRNHVPSAYVHSVNWHGWSGPVNVVFSGSRVCTNLTDAEWALVQIGDRPAQCRWYAPRGR